MWSQLKKSWFVVFSVILLLSSFVLMPWAESAQAAGDYEDEEIDIEELELTAEEEEKAKQLAEEMEKMSILASNLDQDDIDQVLAALNDPEQTDIEPASLATTEEEVAAINDELEENDLSPLPEGTESVDLQEDGQFLAVTDSGEETEISPMWTGTAWQIT
ncbi:hypothetical protein [Salsuginibacillus kocurii]|uniref:hypothetical protein n=1 Tax=Salsuginibacillus kocurii TaxID=427078 RepID=UPI00035DCBD8|nr:hypothetical protein [Salsuginibacillus kocurii]